MRAGFVHLFERKPNNEFSIPSALEWWLSVAKHEERACTPSSSPNPANPTSCSWLEVPDPVPGPGEVVIDIAASGVNRADLMQRQGLYPPPPGAPPYPGLECSGRIRAVGDGVADWRPGDEVCALLAGGGYAEQVVVPAGQVLPMPDKVSMTTAAAFPETACTVYSNVFQLAGLAAGETLLVHGGGSGIGTMAIQLGKAFGARVACTAGSAQKLARCRELGADITINYREEDFVAALLDATDGAGADVILDIMGASYLARNLAALATDGRLVIIGRQGGSRAELDLGVLQGKRASVHATTLRSRPAGQKAEVVAAVRDHVWPLIGTGQVKAVIDQELPMSQAPAGAPGHGGQRAHRQDLARARNDSPPARAGGRIGQTRGMSDGMNPQAQEHPQVLVVGPEGIAMPGREQDGRRRTPAASARSPRWSSSRPRSCGSAT